jgi:hypothetical protein
MITAMLLLLFKKVYALAKQCATVTCMARALLLPNAHNATMNNKYFDFERCLMAQA